MDEPHPDIPESPDGPAVTRSHVSAWQVLKAAIAGFFDHGAMAMSASLAFYTLLSFAPLLVLLVWLASLLGYDSQQTIIDQVGGLAGAAAAKTTASVFQGIGARPRLGSIAGIISIVVSLVSATRVFAQLQTSLNRIWGIRAKPGKALWGWLHQRMLAVGVIGAVVFLLIVSLLVSSGLGMLLTRTGVLWDIINQAITAAVFAFLFALLFRYLPDARMPWRRVLRGGVVTAVLFAFGKWAIGYYLASGDVGSAYGAASSLVLLLIWVYYSGAIFFFGAEVVRAWASVSGDTIRPQRHAVMIGDKGDGGN